MKFSPSCPRSGGGGRGRGPSAGAGSSPPGTIHLTSPRGFWGRSRGIERVGASPGARIRFRAFPMSFLIRPSHPPGVHPFPIRLTHRSASTSAPVFKPDASTPPPPAVILRGGEPSPASRRSRFVHRPFRPVPHGSAYMLIKKPEIPSSEITPEAMYLSRRQFFGASAAALAGAAIPALAACDTTDGAAAARHGGRRPAGRRAHAAGRRDQLQQLLRVRHRTRKIPPARRRAAQTTPWTVVVDGLCDRPGRYGFERLRPRHAAGGPHVPAALRGGVVHGHPVARHPPARRDRPRAPAAGARFVEFTTLHDPEQMPGQRRAVLRWPYVEGLRMDEAMHPLALLATGLYGRAMPGAERRAASAWWCRGSTASSPSSPSCASASPTRSRAPRGTCRRRRNTGSTPT